MMFLIISLLVLQSINAFVIPCQRQIYSRNSIFNIKGDSLKIAKLNDFSKTMFTPRILKMSSVEDYAVRSVKKIPLPSHPKRIEGKLENGFTYVILPNKNPPERFEVYKYMIYIVFPHLKE